MDADFEKAALKTALLIIHWIFDTFALSGYGFPFDMQHFLFYKRLVAGYEKIGQLLEQVKCKPFYQLAKLLQRIADDDSFEDLAGHLEKNETIFKELRDALQIAMPEGIKD